MEKKVIKNPRGQNVGQEIHMEVEVSKDDERGWCAEKDSRPGAEVFSRSKRVKE